MVLKQKVISQNSMSLVQSMLFPDDFEHFPYEIDPIWSQGGKQK